MGTRLGSTELEGMNLGPRLMAREKVVDDMENAHPWSQRQLNLQRNTMK
jgi:hypothetical protein